MSAPGHDPGHAGRVDPGREPAEVAVAEEGGDVEEEGGEPGQVEERVLLDRGDDVVGEVQLLQLLQPDQGLGADRLDGVAGDGEVAQTAQAVERVRVVWEMSEMVKNIIFFIFFY